MAIFGFVVAGFFAAALVTVALVGAIFAFFGAGEALAAVLALVVVADFFVTALVVTGDCDASAGTTIGASLRGYVSWPRWSGLPGCTSAQSAPANCL